MKTIKKLFVILSREFKISIKNLSDLLSKIVYFFLAIFIFIFSIGPDGEILNKVGIGILWALLLLSSTLSLKRYYEEDFYNGTLAIIHIGGLSYEVIALVKIFSNFILIQVPFLIAIPFATLLINLPYNKIKLLLISFLIGSLILSCLGSIAASMNLLNKRNYALGSLIVMLFSIPVIIFSVGAVSIEKDFVSMINILTGILLIILAISPWSSAACIKLAYANK